MRLFSIAILSGLVAASALATDIPLALPQYNLRLQNLGGAAAQFPTGNVTLGGVDFSIPVVGNNYWRADNGNATLNITGLDIEGATSVHMLLNTWWGSASRGATITVTSELGVQYQKTVMGNVDMRDYLQNIYTNTISAPTTQNVFLAGSGQGNQVRLDKVVFDLPASFLVDPIASIQIQDTGANNVSRVMVSGVTVQTAPVPEPASMAVLGLGLAALRRRRAKK